MCAAAAGDRTIFPKSPSSPPNALEQFTYDTAGNRLTDLTHTNYQYNELNQLIEDDSCMYNYDADGNMTARIDKKTGDSTVFTWDIENKLTEVRKPGMIAKYTYDALGRRMSKTVNGETKKFGYDGNDLILEMSENDSIVADYTNGPGIDNPLMMNRAGENYYYAKDGLGSVTALTDSTGNVVNQYKYSVFGGIVEEMGDSVENPFTYTSREIDRETGLMYYRARYYNPEIGRFISEDPIGFWGRDYNFYRYVNNSSVNFIAPYGLLNPVVAVFAVGVAASQIVLLWQLARYGEDYRGRGPVQGPSGLSSAPSRTVEERQYAPSRVLDPNYPHDLNPTVIRESPCP
jgi:RHS repeat-associated protein